MNDLGNLYLMAAENYVSIKSTIPKLVPEKSLLLLILDALLINSRT